MSLQSMDGVHGETVKKLELGFRLGLLGLLRFDLVLEHACDHQQKQSQFPEVRAHKYEREAHVSRSSPKVTWVQRQQ